MKIHSFLAFRFSTNTFPIGEIQEIHPNDTNDTNAIEKTTKVIMDTFTYMNKVMTQPQFAAIRTICRNNDEYCSALAADGACKIPKDYQKLKNSNDGSIDVDLYEFMMSECAPACQTCQNFVPRAELEIVRKCVPDFSSNILGPGDINRMFKRIVGESEEGEVVAPKSKIKIHSRPDPPSGNVNFNSIIEGPWVVTIDDFLTQKECLGLILRGHAMGYERSTLEEEKDYSEEELATERDGQDPYRTSTNTWCENECLQDPITQTIIEKLTNATGIPDSHAEHLQLLRYEKGQYYKSHHDVGGNEMYEPSGSRVLTFFLYLSDVKEGGATRLTDLDGDGEEEDHIDIQPKLGRALIWPNVYDDDPLSMDVRTFHEALPVTEGTKYGANAWFYARKYKGDQCDYEALFAIAEKHKSKEDVIHDRFYQDHHDEL